MKQSTEPLNHVYIVSKGKLNTGYEASVQCVCSTLFRAEQIVRAFPYEGLEVTEFERID